MGSLEIHRLIAAETAAEATLLELQGRELGRHRGVSWSGMAAEPQPRSPEAIEARAQARLALRDAWRRSSEGAFISAVADCQAAARAAFTTAERARAGAARGEPAEWRLQVLEDLAAQARALAAGLRQARRAAGR
ncbi:hypothetical protein [Phenylobacterium sp.]|uniref:hypothetical protein n=1 Tax=Phenylobacterium sp. TaxID=1871053 RepID=UPI00289DAADC|nr:hypothetical protein [Phenylobacterium sp.]